VNIIRNWLATDAKLSLEEIQARFAKLGIHLDTTAIHAYRDDAKTLLNRELVFGPEVAQRMFASSTRKGHSAKRKPKAGTLEVTVN
jgi:hypothetical protein